MNRITRREVLQGALATAVPLFTGLPVFSRQPQQQPAWEYVETSAREILPFLKARLEGGLLDVGKFRGFKDGSFVLTPDFSSFVYIPEVFDGSRRLDVSHFQGGLRLKLSAEGINVRGPGLLPTYEANYVNNRGEMELDSFGICDFEIRGGERVFYGSSGMPEDLKATYTENLPRYETLAWHIVNESRFPELVKEVERQR